MKMESERKATTARRMSTPTSSPTVQKTRSRLGGAKGGGGGGGGGGASIGAIKNCIQELDRKPQPSIASHKRALEKVYSTQPYLCNKEADTSSKDYDQVVEQPKELKVARNEESMPMPSSSNSENDDQVQEKEHKIGESCNLESTNSKILRSELVEDDSSNVTDDGLKKTSPKLDDLEVKLTFSESENVGKEQGLIDQVSEIEEKELKLSQFVEVNVGAKEDEVEECLKEQQKVTNSSPADTKNCDKVEEANEIEQNKIIEKVDDIGSGDQFNEVDVSEKSKQVKSKRKLSPSVNTKFNSASTPGPTPSSSSPVQCKTFPVRRKSIRKSSSRSPSPLPTARKVQFQDDNNFKCPETHGKLQFLVDIVMWRDVSKSAFMFGVGAFIILSSSYAEDFNFSLISAASYVILVYLAIVFLCKSIVGRGVIEDGEVVPDNYIWGEDEAIWLAKMVLPYINESFLKLRVLFSGDPAITMKVATLLFVLARCGSSISVWKMVKLGFFGVFIIPKLCSSYSTQIIAYGNFWMRRFRDAWKSCLHKKAIVFVVFITLWNFSSVVARAWAAFMLFVAFRYYHHQYVMSQDEEQIRSHDVHIRRSSVRQRCKASSTSLYQNKEKKSF